VSLVTGGQQRAVRRMQRDLGLEEPIEAPQVDTIRHGGHRITPNTVSRRPAPKRPDVRSKKTSRDEADGTQSVYVANLPWQATSDEIAEMFGRYGEVHQATIITDRQTGRSKGFGFVDMSRPGALSAIDALHGSRLDGREMTVRPARPRRRR